MYEFLEKFFGTGENGEAKALTFAELQTAMSADKDIKLVNLSEGGYVAKDKFEAKEAELKAIKEQLTSANDQIKSFEGEDIDGIKKKVSEWEKKYEADTEALKQKMDEQETRHQRDLYFANMKFASAAAKRGIMAEFDEQKFQLKDGVFQGADAWIEKMKSDDPASFVLDKKPEIVGESEATAQAATEAPDVTAQQIPTGAAFRPQFATQTSNGSGTDPNQQNVFHMQFAGVRKRPDNQ